MESRTSDGSAIAGVTGQLDSGPTVTTHSAGYYTFYGVLDGNHTVTPSRPNFVFSPTSRNFTVAGANVAGLNFIGTNVG